MTDEPEPMDVEAVLDGLNRVLALQRRAALAYGHVGGALVGFQFGAFAGQLAAFGREELDDARRLVEKVVALEGTPTAEVAPLEHHADPHAAVAWLVRIEEEAIDAMKAVIADTGQEGRSEALEHRLEHSIMRKQEQVDALLRASREPR